MIQSLPPGPTSTLEVTFPHEVWRGHTSKAYQWYTEAMVRVPGQTPNGAHTLMLLAASSDGNERSCVFCFHLFSLSVCSNSSAENQAFKRWPFKGMVACRHEVGTANKSVGPSSPRAGVEGTGVSLQESEPKLSPRETLCPLPPCPGLRLPQCHYH